MSKKSLYKFILVIDRTNLSKGMLRSIMRRFSKYRNRWRLHLSKKINWQIIQCDHKNLKSRVIDEKGVGEWQKHPEQSAEWSDFNASRKSSTTGK